MGYFPVQIALLTDNLQAHLFDIGIDKLILGPTDALKTIELGEDDEDVINEV